MIPWIVSFFETSNSGDFDIVRALIDGIGMAWEALTLPIRGVITIIQTLIDAFTQVSTGQTDILSAALNVWNTMHQFINNILLQIITTVMGWAGQMLSQAVNAGSNFIKGVLQYMRTLPARVLVLLLTV